MASLPLQASFDALSLIVRWLRQGSNNEDLVPAIHHCFSSTAFTAKEIIQAIPYEHFEIAWFSPDDLDDFEEINVLGWRLMIHPHTLKQLSGKRLVVRNTGTSRPNDPCVQTHVLVAVPLQTNPT